MDTVHPAVSMVKSFVQSLPGLFVNFHKAPFDLSVPEEKNKVGCDHSDVKAIEYQYVIRSPDEFVGDAEKVTCDHDNMEPRRFAARAPALKRFCY
jgi:hypothetical protein